MENREISDNELNHRTHVGTPLISQCLSEPLTRTHAINNSFVFAVKKHGDFAVRRATIKHPIPFAPSSGIIGQKYQKERMTAEHKLMSAAESQLLPIKNQVQEIQSKKRRSLSKQDTAANTRRKMIAGALLVDIRLRMRRQKYKG